MINVQKYNFVTLITGWIIFTEEDIFCFVLQLLSSNSGQIAFMLLVVNVDANCCTATNVQGSAANQ